MKILYAIQATGYGHLTRAVEVLPLLKKMAKVDVLISGSESSVKFPINIDYQLKGISFVSSENGGIDYWKSFRLLDTKKFLRSVLELPVENYSLVINDFEPVSAWSAKLKGIPSVSLSHQCAVLHPEVPKPLIKDPIAYTFLKTFAPTDKSYGFHFKEYGENIYTPIIRKHLRNIEVTQENHITVYLPAYSDEKLLKKLSQFKDTEWHIFSKTCTKKYRQKNIFFYPTDINRFLESMASSNGVLCGAGFETPAEALFLKKKLLVIPMKGQFEQEFNAHALHSMGVRVIKNLKQKRIPLIQEWLNHAYVPNIEYEDNTVTILEEILDTHFA